MKEVFFFLISFYFVSIGLWAQNFNEARNYFLTLEDQINEEDTVLISYPALNVFMARKVNTYLVGSSDLSLNRSYFILNPTEGRLFLGHNFAKDPSKELRRTRSVFTIGLKADVEKGVASFFSGASDELSSNLGAAIKLTLLGRGKIYFDTSGYQIQRKRLKELNLVDTARIVFSQKKVAAFNRREFRHELLNKMADDSISFEKKMSSIGDRSYATAKRGKFYGQKNDEYKSLYITKEADALDAEEYYDAFYNHWVSLDFYVPFTGSTYTVAEAFSSPIHTREIYNFEGSLLWSHIYEKRTVRFLGSLSVGGKLLNNINTAQLDAFSIADYLQLGGIDTLKLARLDDKDVYVGPYESHFTPFAQLHIVSFFIAKKNLGLSLQVERFWGNYNPLNLKIGIPFVQEGKDGKTSVAFEVQFKWEDLNDQIFPNKVAHEKFTTGLSVGVPLTSKIY